MRQGNTVFGIILILAGGLFLLNNLGIFNVDFWGVLWSLVIIGAGVWMLLGIVGRGSKETRDLTIPLDESERVKLELRHGAGRVELGSGAAAGAILNGNFEGGVEWRSRQSSDRLELILQPPSGFLSLFPFSRPHNWSIHLSDQVAFSIVHQGAASETRMDLRDLKVTDLLLQTGASSTTIVLPANAGFTKAKVEAGAAGVVLEIPEGVAGRIRSTSGLAEIRVDRNRFPKSGGVYQSAEYATAENKVELDLAMGVGSVEVR
jgi:hypothetical protein